MRDVGECLQAMLSWSGCASQTLWAKTCEVRDGATDVDAADRCRAEHDRHLSRWRFHVVELALHGQEDCEGSFCQCDGGLLRLFILLHSAYRGPVTHAACLTAAVEECT